MLTGTLGTDKGCGSCGDVVIGCGMLDYTICISGEYIYIYILNYIKAGSNRVVWVG